MTALDNHPYLVSMSFAQRPFRVFCNTQEEADTILKDVQEAVEAGHKTVIIQGRLVILNNLISLTIIQKGTNCDDVQWLSRGH